MLTASQIRMARAGLGWSAARLAEAAGVTLRTVQHLEAGSRGGRMTTWAALEHALRDAGVEFIGEDGVRIPAGACADRPALPPG